MVGGSSPGPGAGSGHKADLKGWERAKGWAPIQRTAHMITETSTALLVRADATRTTGSDGTVITGPRLSEWGSGR